MKASIKKEVRNASLPEPKLKPTKPVNTGKAPSVLEFGALPQSEYERRLAKAREQSRKNRSDIWTYEEEETIKVMARRGHDYKQIAKSLPNRTLKAVEAKYRRMIRRGDI